jgi:hypothetical protein
MNLRARALTCVNGFASAAFLAVNSSWAQDEEQPPRPASATADMVEEERMLEDRMTDFQKRLVLPETTQRMMEEATQR